MSSSVPALRTEARQDIPQAFQHRLLEPLQPLAQIGELQGPTPSGGSSGAVSSRLEVSRLERCCSCRLSSARAQGTSSSPSNSSSPSVPQSACPPHVISPPISSSTRRSRGRMAQRAAKVPASSQHRATVPSPASRQIWLVSRDRMAMTTTL